MYCLCVKNVSDWHWKAILGGAAGIFLHSSFFSAFSRYQLFLLVDFVGDDVLSPKLFEEQPFHVLLFVNWLHWP